MKQDQLYAEYLDKKQGSNPDDSGMMKLFEEIQSEANKESDLSSVQGQQKTPFNTIDPQSGDSVQQLEFEELRINTRPQTWGPDRDVIERPDGDVIEKRKSFLERTMPEIYKRIMSAKNSSRDFVEDNYENNFIINYHSHQTILPVPLQVFATSCEISHQTEAPFESASINLQMGFDTATVIFGGEDGHPSPGGWILIRQKSTSDERVEEFVPSEFHHLGSGVKNVSPALFLGTISSITWDLQSDQNGTMQCNINLQVNSFVHNLMYGEYKVNSNPLYDDKYSYFKQAVGLTRDPSLPLPSELAQLNQQVDSLSLESDRQTQILTSNESIISAYDNGDTTITFAEYEAAGLAYNNAEIELERINSELESLSSEIERLDQDFLPGIPSSEDRNMATPLFTPSGYSSSPFMTDVNNIGGYFSQLQIMLSGKKIKIKGPDGKETESRFTKPQSSFILNDVLRKFAYPVMPLSFYAEPLDLEVLFNTYGKAIEEGLLPQDPQEFYEFLKDGIFKGEGFVLQALFLGIVYIFKDSPEYQMFKRPGNIPTTSESPVRQYDNIRNYSVTDPDYFSSPEGSSSPVGKNYFSSNTVSSPITGKTIDDYLEYASLFSLNTSTVYDGLKLGDVIHVATTRDDVPISSELWSAMPKTEQTEIDPRNITNINQKNTTIWGLLSGTFQYDPEIVELYPTIIPLKGLDSQKLSKEVYSKNYNKAIEDLKQKGFEDTLLDLKPKSSLNYPHPLWHAIGGIPTLVYRLKPMHPVLKGSIAKDRIDAIRRVQDRIRFGGLPVEPLQYITDFEKLKGFERTSPKGRIQFRVLDEYVDNSYFEPKSIQLENKQTISVTSQNEIIQSKYEVETQGLTSPTQNFSSPDKPVRQGMQRIDVDSKSGYVTYQDVKKLALPVYVDRNEITSFRFSQLDTLRVNNTRSTAFNIEGLSAQTSGTEKAGINSKYVVNVDSALKYGLRTYENIIPFHYNNSFESKPDTALKVLEEEIKELTQTYGSVPTSKIAYLYELYNSELVKSSQGYNKIRMGASAERLYMMMGDEQKYFRGVLNCVLLLNKEILPGMWIEIAMTDPKIKEAYKATSGGYGVHSGIIFAYVTGVSHSYSVNQETGLVNAITSINFERGSIGGVIPNFPSRLDAQTEEDVGFDSFTKALKKYGNIDIGTSIEFSPAGFAVVDFSILDSGDADTQSKTVLLDSALNWAKTQYELGNLSKEEYDAALNVAESGENPLSKDDYSSTLALVELLENEGLEVPQDLLAQIEFLRS